MTTFINTFLEFQNLMPRDRRHIWQTIKFKNEVTWVWRPAILALLRHPDGDVYESPGLSRLLLSQLKASNLWAWNTGVLRKLGEELLQENSCCPMQLFSKENRLSTVNFNSKRQTMKIGVRVVEGRWKFGFPGRVQAPRVIDLGAVFLVGIDPPNSIPMALPEWGWAPEAASRDHADFNPDFPHFQMIVVTDEGEERIFPVRKFFLLGKLVW